MSSERVQPPEGVAVPDLRGSADYVRLDFRPRSVDVHMVLDSELTELRQSSPSAWLTFFGIALGSAIAFGSVAFTQELDSGPHAVMLGLFWPSVVLTAAFAVAAIRAHQRGESLVARIRQRGGQ